MLRNIFTHKRLDHITINGIEFKIKHSMRKNMKRIIMRIERKNEIKLSSARVSKKNLLDFIQENETWILTQHNNIKDNYKVGTHFYYLNQAYSIQHHKKALHIQGTEAFINPLKAKYQSDMFYKQSARAYLPRRVEFWKSKMNLEFNKLNFRLAKKRWGSCNAKKNISLNPYMMKLSHEMIDYIIIHELSHLVHLNHSKDFYEHVQTFMPHYESVEKEIKELSLRLI